MSGVARRSWARNEHSIETVIEFNNTHMGTDHVTIPYLANEKLVSDTVSKYFDK